MLVGVILTRLIEVERPTTHCGLVAPFSTLDPGPHKESKAKQTAAALIALCDPSF